MKDVFAAVRIVSYQAGFRAMYCGLPGGSNQISNESSATVQAIKTQRNAHAPQTARIYQQVGTGQKSRCFSPSPFQP